jgi:hypothetical protein
MLVLAITYAYICFTSIYYNYQNFWTIDNSLHLVLL